MKKILLVARNYPPMQGGMGKYAKDLYENISSELKVDLLKNTGNSKNILSFYFRTIFFIFKNNEKYSHIHFCDGVLAPIGIICKIFKKIKLSITIHALDIVYDSFIYQLIIPQCVSYYDEIICVSNFTLKECVKRDIDIDLCRFIPNGVNYSENNNSFLSIEEIEKKYNLDLKDKKILFSVCRLIERKGIAWFIINVINKLPDEYIYLVAGVGPEFSRIKKSIENNALRNRVFALGNINELEKSTLYNYSDLFMMPNIKIKGDAEGFGISIIEAASYGLPSIASDIEGITDAVIPGETGTLVSEGNVDGFIRAIINSDFDKNNVMNVSREYYDWKKIKIRYIEIFNSSI